MIFQAVYSTGSVRAVVIIIHPLNFPYVSISFEL